MDTTTLIEASSFSAVGVSVFAICFYLFIASTKFILVK